MKNNAELATTDKRFEVPTIDLTKQIPNLSDAPEIPIDLVAGYWTPQATGESKRLIFDKMDIRQVPDHETQEAIELECAFFIEPVNGVLNVVSNGSKRLVAAIVNAKIPHGTPLLITYLGKKKNSSNNFQSDNWSVKVLNVGTKK